MEEDPFALIEAMTIAGIAIAITAVLSIARELAPQASAPASWRS